METLFIKTLPVGYWIEDGRGKWMGPFETQFEAEEMAIALCPKKTKTLKLVLLSQSWACEITVSRAGWSGVP